MTKKLGKEIYDDSANFGRIYVIISAIIVTIIGIAMLIGGISILLIKSHLKKISGIITQDSVCIKVPSGNSTVRSCKSYVKYIIDDIKYGYSDGIVVNTGSNSHNKNDKVTVYYDSGAKDKPQIDIIPSVIGWILIIFAILIMIMSWLWVWLIYKSKIAASVEGVYGIVNMIQNK